MSVCKGVGVCERGEHGRVEQIQVKSRPGDTHTNPQKEGKTRSAHPQKEEEVAVVETRRCQYAFVKRARDFG